MTEKFNRVTCEFTESEKERHEEIRRKIIKEYPPADGRSAEPAGYGVAFYAARKSAGMDWYDVALAAGLDDAAIIRAIERGDDTSWSNVTAVAKALGLSIEIGKAG